MLARVLETTPEWLLEGNSEKAPDVSGGRVRSTVREGAPGTQAALYRLRGHLAGALGALAELEALAGEPLSEFAEVVDAIPEPDEVERRDERSARG
jgi:hypothetical protein